MAVQTARSPAQWEDRAGYDIGRVEAGLTALRDQSPAHIHMSPDEAEESLILLEELRTGRRASERKASA